MVSAMEVKKIHDVSEMLKMARKMGKDSAKDYNIWANECAANAVSASKKVFESLVDDKERHIDQYDTELANIENLANATWFYNLSNAAKPCLVELWLTDNLPA